MAGRFSVNVLAIIPDKNGRVLLNRATEYSDWTLPGGRVLDGENIQQALQREVRERTGLSVEVGPLYDIFSDAGNSAVSYFYICRETGGVLTLTAKAMEFGEFTIQDIPANVDPAVRQRLFKYWRDPRPNPALIPEEELQELAALQAPPQKPRQARIESPVTSPNPVLPPLIETVEPETPPTQPVAVPIEPPPRPTPKKRGNFRRILFGSGPLLVALSAVLLYSITRQGYFLADDFVVLNQLHFKQTSFFDNLVWFTRDWGVGVNFYRPWVRLAYYFQYLAFSDNAGGWHLFSTGLHAANSLLVWLLVWLILRRGGAATVAGIIFALQPVHTESVSWISGQTDLWATFFALASSCAFVRARQLQRQKRPSFALYLVSLLAFVMGLLSKESAAALPLVLLGYDVVSQGLDRLLGKRPANPQKRASGFAQFALFQAPFWLVLAGYFGLRFALFNGLGGYTVEAGQSLEFPVYLRTNLRWLAAPFQLGGTDGLILLAAILAFLALTGVQEWERFRLARGLPLSEEEGQEQDEQTSRDPKKTRVVPSFWNLRTAAFGIVWAGIFLLPAAFTPPAERFTYLPSVGFALFLAVCLTPFAPRRNEFAVKRRFLRLRDYFDIGSVLRLSAVAVVFITYFVTASDRIQQWNEAGNTAHTLLNRTKEVIPGVVHYTIFVSEGVPESGENALIFRTGYPEAMQILYNDATVESRLVEHFPIAEQQLDRTIFLEYKDDKLINHYQVIQTLLARNNNLKKEKVAQLWNFSESNANGQANPRGNWSEISGTGRTEVKNGALELTAPGAAEIQSPGLNLPAVQLGTVEITLKASPRNSNSANSYRMSVSWEPLPTGEPRQIEPVSFDITADGQYHTYKITPQVATNYNYVDNIAYLRLQIPADLQNVAIQTVQQNSIPVEYASLNS
jgi:ADP-ribose pyrophosphatase YjhB (NUDIX family)/dolichol kinase